jgi:hypothetical protein
MQTTRNPPCKLSIQLFFDMKSILIFILLLGITESISSQNLQWYWYLKIGANHNLSVYEDNSGLTERSIKTPQGFYSLTATKPSAVELNPRGGLSFVDYTFHYPVGFYVTSPFFVTSGIEYRPVSVRHVYRTSIIDQDGYFFVMDELNTMHTLAIPVFIDTRPLYNKLTLYGGIRFHVNIQNWQLQKISWNEPNRLRKTNFGNSELLRTNISYALGLTFSILSFEFALHPSVFLNQDYVDIYGKRPYVHLSNSIKSVSASIMIGKLRKKD